MINRNTLPQDVQEILNKILAEEPSDLNQEALDFLRARQSYLTNAEKEIYFPSAVDMSKVDESMIGPNLPENEVIKPVVKQKRHRRNKNK